MMKKRNRFKFCVFVFSFFSVLQAQCQKHFAYKSAIDTIKETKFYKINLSPGVVAKCKPGLDDIRIFDEGGKPVPYILKNDLPVFTRENFIAFPIIKTIKEKDKQTHITLQSTIDKPIDNLLLFIKNTEAHRAFNISGSNDSVHWFIIKENIYLDNSFKADGETIIQSLSFPASNYKYFQLTILGEDLLPFNIAKAGVYKEDLIYGRYIQIPAPDISQRDSSNKISYVRIHLDDKYLVNKIIVDLEGVKYYKRKFSFFEQNKMDDFLLEGYLFSGLANEFIVNAKADQFLLTINNEDNNPLKIKAVHAFQLKTYLLTYLQDGKNYFLEFGDSFLQAPKYDLSFFADSADNSPSEIFVNSFEKTENVSSTNLASAKNNKLFLWVSIAAVLAALLYFTFKLMREVNKKTLNN
ncbi:MAG: hypothetical protein M3015_11710 [Bacteroidota bacterium]|nr:hypothetical protein [Bacteroidota bacterium]